jgi:hypothetical protein
MGWWFGLAPVILEFWVQFPNERSQGKHAPILYGSNNLLVVCNIPTITTILIILFANYLQTVEGLTIFLLHNQGGEDRGTCERF